MPWQGTKRFPFAPYSVTWNAPPQSGVYLLYDSDERVIQVGESADLKACLLAHLFGDDPGLSPHAPTLFAYELVPTPAGRRTRARALILELHPPGTVVSSAGQRQPAWAGRDAGQPAG